jgi:hypothetical protein
VTDEESRLTAEMDDEPMRGTDEYLCVDEFLADAVSARALATALELGVIDLLVGTGECSAEEVRARYGGDPQGCGLLCDLLSAGGVVRQAGGRVELSPAFRSALRYRDLLEAKLEFAHWAALDYSVLLTALIKRPDEFQRRAGIFDLFNYGRCSDFSPENLARTRRWMRITTALTRYEAAACLRHHDFGRHRRMLDIGGNSGEFALQVCRGLPSIQATVFDLPLVCRIGQEHVRPWPEANRITFMPGNAFAEPLPRGFDLISFKSMLHDWPDAQAGQLLERAVASLSSGGALLVFERAPVRIPAGGVPHWLMPFLLFFRSFRNPEFYAMRLAALGLQAVRIQTVPLDMPFSLVTGVKAGG